MADILYDRDTSLDALRDTCVGLIGYGNQGRAHALNLRDSGIDVQVASRPNSSARARCEHDGFPARNIEEVVADCRVLALLLPDEVLPQVYIESMERYIQPRTAFVFAHGFAVHHKTIRLPEDVDIILVAPTGPGRQLRSLFEEGRGLPALIAVDQDASGKAWPICGAYARAIGCTRAGAIKTTFAEETVTDLFCEQAVLCGGLPELIKASFDTLVERGYQSELAYISCLKEVKLIADLLFSHGIDGMRQAISTTARYGSAVAGPRIIDAATRHHLRQILCDIENGSFARAFLKEATNGGGTMQELVAREKHSRLARTGRYLSQSLDF